MAGQSIEIGTVTAELALRHENWPKELRGVCETLQRAPAESLTAMTVTIHLHRPDEEDELRALSADLAEHYQLLRAVTCVERVCTIRLSRFTDRESAPATAGGQPASPPDGGFPGRLARTFEATRRRCGARTRR